MYWGSGTAVGKIMSPPGPGIVDDLDNFTRKLRAVTNLVGNNKQLKVYRWTIENNY